MINLYSSIMPDETITQIVPYGIMPFGFLTDTEAKLLYVQPALTPLLGFIQLNKANYNQG